MLNVYIIHYCKNVYNIFCNQKIITKKHRNRFKIYTERVRTRWQTKHLLLRMHQRLYDSIVMVISTIITFTASPENDKIDKNVCWIRVDLQLLRQRYLANRKMKDADTVPIKYITTIICVVESSDFISNNLPLQF